MGRYQRQVAVVTGAASGIGREIAARCVREGMNTVLADIDASALANCERELSGAGGKAVAHQVDVSDAAAVEGLARQADATFGRVDYLFSNAGVQTYSTTWETSLEEWRWVVGVNLWGVIHGIKSFVPIMLAQENGGTIVNTASMGGLTSGSLGVYRASKHAVVALTEALHHELTQRGGNIRVAAFCPDVIATRIVDSSRNSPPGVVDPDAESNAAMTRERIRGAVAQGESPARAVDALFAGIEAGQFYIYTNPTAQERIRMRLEDVLGGGAPRNPLAPRP